MPILALKIFVFRSIIIHVKRISTLRNNKERNFNNKIKKLKTKI